LGSKVGRGPRVSLWGERTLAGVWWKKRGFRSNSTTKRERGKVKSKPPHWTHTRLPSENELYSNGRQRFTQPKGDKGGGGKDKTGGGEIRSRGPIEKDN